MNLLLPDAFATGKLRAIPNVVVRELSVDKNTGRVNEVHFVDRISRREMSVKARVVIVAAGTLESTRLLLNSNLANSRRSHGALSDRSNLWGWTGLLRCPRRVTVKRGMIRQGLSLWEAAGFFRVFAILDQATKASNFLRGYSLNLWSGPGPMDPRSFAAYGQELQQKMESYHGSGFSMGIMGEVLARRENHVRINPNVKDAWGIPALHISTRYTDNEFNMARDAVDTGAELAGGGRL